MWLVLCRPDDLPALWAWRGLRARGLKDIEVVPEGMLATALRWAHRLGPAGASTDLELADGRRLPAERLRGVLNRVAVATPPPWPFGTASDREYASQEFQAFLLSWLHSLPCVVLNPAGPEGLCGAWRHGSAWTALAARAGLRTRPWKCDSEGGPPPPDRPPGATVIVVGDSVEGASPPRETADGCRRLAALSGTPLLGVDFEAGPGGAWLFAGATPVPDLRRGGEPLLDALAAALRGGGGAP